MPRASGQKFHYMDHDTETVDEEPPIQNTWYEVFHDQDVRLIWCTVFQTNDENAPKNVQLRWTIDGNVYFVSISIDDNTLNFVSRNYMPSTGGTQGLVVETTSYNAASRTDKRGLDFKVEVRITDVPGTNQRLLCRSVYETKELT